VYPGGRPLATLQVTPQVALLAGFLATMINASIASILL